MIWELIGAFVLAFATSAYGTLVGGAALLNVPYLILVGLPPHNAIATHKFGINGIAVGGLYVFSREKLINYKLGAFLAVFALSGAVIGANIMLTIDENILRKTIGVVTIIILIVLVLNRTEGLQKKKKIITPGKWTTAAMVSLGFGIYSGFFGGGFGTLMMYFIVLMFGYTFLQGSGVVKIVAAATNLAATAVFFLNDVIVFSFAGVMLLGTVLGSYAGARYGIRRGNLWVRNLFMVVALLMALRLLL